MKVKSKEEFKQLGINDKITNISEVIFINRGEINMNYNISEIYEVKFEDLNINDSFFDSLKKDYPGFVDWYERNSNRNVYCYKKQDKILGLLALKIEYPESEDYSEIKPMMERNRKLKISTFKVEVGGKKIGEKFMKIIFDQALFSMVDEIYVTIYDNDDKKKNLIRYFEEFGFNYYGRKNNELVYIKNMKKI